MRSLLSTIRQFLSELRRRNVYQVAVTYVVVGFFVIEAADLTLTRLGLPGWTVTLVVVLVGLGFPLALVMAWALEVTPEGVRVEESVEEETDDSVEVPSSTGTTQDLWVGASVLALLLLGVWWIWGGMGGEGSADQAKSGAPEIQDRSIAVLPFEVSGAGAEEWRDGMVTMLSAGLDGAAGLRAVADRTIFARWEEAVGPKEGATRTEALSVARTIGARYTVVGSAGVLGEDLRLLADVYETGSGNRLGRAQVRGSPEEIMALTDALTRKVLGILLEKSEDRVPSVDLASIISSSLEALKAFLEGERHLRAGEYEAAIEAFETATQQDSTFALAYARLGLARDWVGAFEAGSRASRRAYDLSGRLPRRERRIVQAEHYLRTLAAADSLRRLAKDYPNDPTIWYFLGEKLYHGAPPFYGAIPRGLPEAEEAFRRAVDLDPGFAQYHHHLVGLAFSLHRDSALATERIRAHPEGMIKRTHKLAWDLVFGSPGEQERALAQVKQFSVSERRPIFFLGVIEHTLRHPTDGALQEKVLLRLKKREDLEGLHAQYTNPWLVMNSFERGQVEKATARLRTLELRPPNPSCLPTWSETLGIGVPDSTLRARLDPSRIEEGTSTRRLMCAGLYLLEQDRSEELPALIDRLEAAGTKHGLTEGEVQRRIDEVKGYQAFTAGEFQEAERRWSGHNESGYWGAIWRGDLYREMGELEKAEGWYLAAWWHPMAHERLGQLYEKMDKPGKAAAAYRRFIDAWTNADPALQDRVNTARQRMKRLAEGTAAE